MQTFAITALSRRLSRKISLPFFTASHFKKDVVGECERAPNTIRYKSEGLDALCRSTHFTRKELQRMFRGFKQECPSGIVSEANFKEIYSQFFPLADSDSYAHYVFNTFDHDRDGSVNFDDFITALSILARGSEEDKLLWIFSLYDLNGDGVITKDELHDVISSVYGLMGKEVQTPADAVTADEHAARVFQILDKNKDGVISVGEFMEACQSDEKISESMKMFDTCL